MEKCEDCANWIRDPIPFKEIYFGKCTVDNQIKYGFQECDCKQLAENLTIIKSSKS